MERLPCEAVVPETAIREPFRTARAYPARGSHGVPLKHEVRPPDSRVVYGGGSSRTWWLRSPEAVRYGGRRYSSPQSPGIGASPKAAAAIALRSASSRASEKTRALSSRCERSPSRAPTMTAATAGSSRMARQATFAIEIPCFRATAATARASSWKRSHPPATSMKRWYFISDQVARSASVGAGRSSQRSVRNPPASTP